MQCKNTKLKIGLTDSEIVLAQERNLEPTISQYCREYKQGKIKKIGKENKDVNLMILEQLQVKPELLDEYPALDIEYERNGDIVQRKSLAKILEAYEQMLGLATNQKEVQRISSLCSDILLNGGAIPEEKMQEELEKIMQFKSDNPIINAYKNKILTTKFTKEMVMMSSMKSMYEKTSQQDRNGIQDVFKGVIQGEYEQGLTQQNEKVEWR